MKLLRALVISIGVIATFALVTLLMLLGMYFIDIYVLGWFGLPTNEGWGIAVGAAIIMIAFVTAMVYDEV